MSIHMLPSIAKKDLSTIVMKNDTVKEYYHRIFNLFEDEALLPTSGLKSSYRP